MPFNFMIQKKKSPCPRLALILATSWSTAITPAFAGHPANADPTDQISPASPAAPAPGVRTQNVTINLINRLVEKNILTAEEAAEMIKTAEADAAAARDEAAAAKNELARARALIAEVPQQAAAAVAASKSVPEFSTPMEDTVSVPYIPEMVKSQMRDQIKQEIMDQARNENWVNPRALPDWVSRFRFNGDFRLRAEADLYPSGNDNTGAFPNFNAINTGQPFDTAGTVFSPQLNVDQRREKLKLRARFGVEVDLEDGFTAGFRMGTGENDTPVSENQGLGTANGAQGGDFSKYALWLDRAFVRYDLGKDPKKRLTFLAGRFDNPFFGTTMIWVDDMGFDGVAMKGTYQIGRYTTPFLTAGAFPVFNTDLNFSTNNPAKFKSSDKWLYAAQFGTDLKVGKDFDAKVAAAYYYFVNVAGKLSTPFTPINSTDSGNTDDLRPSFAQKGNTYIALRDIVPNANNDYGTINQWQYYGLATGFHELALTGRLEYNHYEPFQIAVVGEFVKNLAFNKNAAAAQAVNNFGPTTATGAGGPYQGGDMGWTVDFRVGNAVLEKRWDWKANIGYRYLESDAVIDGFNDNDFGGGGTNVKGYILGGKLALSKRVWLGMNWMSTSQIAGPPLKADTFWFDINAKF